MKTRLIILLASLAVFASVYSAEPPKSDSEILQGKWVGKEQNPGAPNGFCHLTLTGNKLDFVGADTNEWYKGTFTLHEDVNPKQFVGVIKECPSSDCIGITVYAIYNIKDGKFTISGNAPGETNFPSSFDASGTRQILFQRKEDEAKSAK